MVTRKKFLDWMGFSRRKKIYYALIFCILLIQVCIALYFYNEITSRKELAALENQRVQVNILEHSIQQSHIKLAQTQNDFQHLLLTEDAANLNTVFTSGRELHNALANIGSVKNKNADLRALLSLENKDTAETAFLQHFIYTSFELSDADTNAVAKKTQNNNFHRDFTLYLQAEDERIRAASATGSHIAPDNKDAHRSEQALPKAKASNTSATSPSAPAEMKLDSAVDLVNRHFSDEICKYKAFYEKNNTPTVENTIAFFRNSIIFSTVLLNGYSQALQNSKVEIENSIIRETAKVEKTRSLMLITVLFLLMSVCILILFFLRIGFLYEQRLMAANKQISDNLVFKNRILGMLSHELRSPLKIMDIFLTKISARTEDSTVKKYLKSVSYTNKTLLVQANQILEYTKNQQVGNTLKSEVFILKKEVQSILEAAESYIETRNNILIVHEDIDPDLKVYSDCTKINQLFINFLSNATKFTENGKIYVDITLEPVNSETISMITTITDTGIGIEEKDIKKIFDPYYQGQISQEADKLGAGLGLSLCKELVALYGGNVEISSKKNVGTKVIFNLNLKIHAS